MPKITWYKIFQTIKRIQTKKNPGLDLISNVIFKVIIHKICNCLAQIFNNLLRLGYYFSYLQESIVVILRKIGDNQDCTGLKMYRPISLFNTLSKIIEAKLATRINYMGITYNLLPETYFRGCQGL